MKRFLIAIIILFAALPIHATNYTVKSSGGSFTTMAACAAQMSTNGTGVSDTCTVFAGTYSEVVTVPAGSVGNYKVFTVNGSDVVTVLGFTLNSHTKLIGNCPEKQGTVTTATCGFFISNPSSPGSAACVALGTSTDVYIRHNVMYACGAGGVPGPANCGAGMIHASPNSSFLYIQGNTLSYANNTIGNPVGVGMDIGDPSGSGDHYLVENNDLSHYDLGIKFNNQFGVYRNNNFHDQLDAEGCQNGHTDEFFSEPGTTSTTVQHNLFEGNFQRNAVGLNSKTMLMQNDNNTQCPNCSYAIVRYNVVSGIGSSAASNYYWPHIMNYNNTVVDPLTAGASNNTADYAELSPTGSYINNLYLFHFSSSQSNWNVYKCGSGCNFGYNLYFCATSNCSSVWGNIPATPFLNDTGNKNADPKFVNYVGFGNAANDYHLQVGSPAIGTGTKLTTVNGTISSSTLLVVNDVSYFQDGYGLSNAYSTVNADCIAVTTALNHVCITSINYSTNTLTLATPISATNGDSVWLWKDSSGNVQLPGVNPNIGAFQTATPVPIATFTPSSVNFGNVPAGLTSNPIPVTLQNTGAANLVVSTVSLGSAVFSLINNTCGSPATITNTIPGTGFTLTPGASCTFQAIYQPAVPNFTNTASVFFSPGASNPDALSLTGNSTGPAAPSIINFAGNFTSSGTVVVK